MQCQQPVVGSGTGMCDKSWTNAAGTWQLTNSHLTSSRSQHTLVHRIIGGGMRSRTIKGILAIVVMAGAAGWNLARPAAAPQAPGLALQSLSVLTFSPTGVLFAADPQGAAIYALELGNAQSVKAGAADVAAIDQKIASLLGTDTAAVSI